MTTTTQQRKRNSATKLRGATYIRMSTGKQEDSPERQQADIGAIPIFKECTITPEREYSDHAMTGTKSANRPGFQRLLADADAGLIDIVLLSETSRLTREGVLDQLMHYKRIIDAGVRVFSTRKGEVRFDDLGSLLSSIVDFHSNRDESIKIADRTTHGRYLAALRGEWVSAAPYAYKKKYRDEERHKRGYLVLGDKEERRIVRWIFKQYTETDTSFRAMASELNHSGARTRRGTKWSYNALRDILVRPCYKGTAAYNQTAQGQFRTMKDGKLAQGPGTVEAKPKGDWIYHDCKAIVSEELWEAAQRKMTKRTNRSTPHAGGGEFLLSGLLYCTQCGSRMSGQTKWRGGEKARKLKTLGFRRMYFCKTNSKYGRDHCGHNAIREDDLLAYLVGVIQEQLLSPKYLDRLRERVKRELGQKNSPVPSQTKELRRRVRELDQDIRDGMAELARTPDDLHALAVERVRTLRTERDQVAANLEEAECRAQRPQNDADSDVERALGDLSRLREDITSATPAVAREALQLG